MSSATHLESKTLTFILAGGEGERLSAHAVLRAPGAHALAEAREIGVFLLL